MFQNLNGAKLASKRVKRLFGLQLSQAQELVARAVGYQDWHQLTQNVGTPSTPGNGKHATGASLLAYAKTRGFDHKVDLEFLWAEIDSCEQLSDIDQADRIAFLAQDALDEGRMDDCHAHIARALELDPFCPPALHLKARFLPTIRKRMSLYKDAVRGALRTISEAKTSLVETLIGPEDSFVRPRSSAGSIKIPKTAAPSPSNGIPDDQWKCIERRDLIRSWFLLGEAYLRHAQPDVAAAALEELARLSPYNRMESMVWLCSALIADGQTFLAREYLSTGRILDSSETWPDIVSTLCDIAEWKEPEVSSFRETWDNFLSHLSELVWPEHRPGPDVSPEFYREYVPMPECEQLLIREHARALSHAVMLNPILHEIFLVPSDENTLN